MLPSFEPRQYYTLPPGSTMDEDKTAHRYYGGSGIGYNLVTLFLHEVSHSFGLNHEWRYLNTMGNDTMSANGGRLMDWLSEDITRWFSLNYPSTVPYRDLSVRHVKYVGYDPGFPIFTFNWDWANFLSTGDLGYLIQVTSVVNQTGYAVTDRTRAYEGPNLSDSSPPGGYSGSKIGSSYHINPRECMVPDTDYYVEFEYENNGSQDEADQIVKFYLSDNDTIDPTDMDTGFSDTISFKLDSKGFDPWYTIPNPLNPSVPLVDGWFWCYDFPLCSIVSRRSVTVPTRQYGSGISVTKRSRIQIPSGLVSGLPRPYYIGPYIDPNNEILEGNEDNNGSYMEVYVKSTCS